ncbi:MAG: hypothetical protein Tsb0034_11920 [Ekhidna sp.]
MVQGRGVDPSLNDEGIRQSLSAFNVLKKEGFDHIYTSSLKRTHETVRPFVEAGIMTSAYEGFDEISWGNQEGKEASYEAKNLYAATVNGWREGNLELNVGGGENPLQVMERQKKAMQEVLNSDHERVLICMHGRAMRVLLCWVLNYPLSYMDGFPHQNCAYYAINYRSDRFYLKHFNKIDHL